MLVTHYGDAGQWALCGRTKPLQTTRTWGEVTCKACGQSRLRELRQMARNAYLAHLKDPTVDPCGWECAVRGGHASGA